MVERKIPATGDMYRCEKCMLEVHVTKGSEQDSPASLLSCCNELMNDVTALEVQNP